jgi:hypothetical protein
MGRRETDYASARGNGRSFHNSRIRCSIRYASAVDLFDVRTTHQNVAVWKHPLFLGACFLECGEAVGKGLSGMRIIISRVLLRAPKLPLERGECQICVAFK